MTGINDAFEFLPESIPKDHQFTIKLNWAQMALLSSCLQYTYLNSDNDDLTVEVVTINDLVDQQIVDQMGEFHEED